MPIDPTPHGGEVLHDAHDDKFPQPKPEQGRSAHPEADERNAADDSKGEPDIAHRPSLPTHVARMAVDIEDEEADPVVDTGPGIDRGD